MSDLSDSFEELLDVNDEATGKKQFAKVGNKKVRAIIEEITTEEIALAGGEGEAGGFRIQTAVSNFAHRPKKGDLIEARGQELEVISCVNRNDVTYEITAGDIANER